MAASTDNHTATADYTGMARQIRQWAGELGFQATGICGIDLAEDEAYLEKWLAAGFHF